MLSQHQHTSTSPSSYRILEGTEDNQTKIEEPSLFVRLAYGYEKISLILWMIFNGWILFLFYIGWALLLMPSIIGIPFALFLIKFAFFVLMPIGYTTVAVNKTQDDYDGQLLEDAPHERFFYFLRFDKYMPAPTDTLALICNIIWFIFCGWALVLLHLGFCVVNAITIIGIGNALVHLQLCFVAIAPFGSKIVKDNFYERMAHMVEVWYKSQGKK
ncbi:hypothetical protein ABK040_004792 [Willaertia magna]